MIGRLWSVLRTGSRKMMCRRELVSQSVEGSTAWRMVVGGRSSVVRASAAQASNLGSIPGDFIPHSIFSLCIV